MNLNSIEAFVAIVENETISKAASMLFVSQPVLTRRLQSLEKELNVQLFSRSPVYLKMKLTSAGQLFIPIAAHWLALWKDTCQISGSETAPLLCVGSVDSYNASIFPGLYRQFSEENPSVRLRIRTQQSVELYRLVSNFDVDIAYTRRQLVYENVLVTPVFNERMLVACPVGSRYGAGPLSPKQLDPSLELYVQWSPNYQLWREHWFGTNVKPLYWLDLISLLSSLLNKPDRWAIVPYTVGYTLQRNCGYELYELLGDPPLQTCYQLIHRYPKPGLMDSIEAFAKTANAVIGQHDLEISGS